MSGPDYPDVAKVQTKANAPTRVGRWYAMGPANRSFVPDDPAFAIFHVVADGAQMPGCVTVLNNEGRRLRVPIDLVYAIVAPAGERWTPLDRAAEHGEQPS